MILSYNFNFFRSIFAGEGGVNIDYWRVSDNELQTPYLNVLAVPNVPETPTKSLKVFTLFPAQFTTEQTRTLTVKGKGNFSINTQSLSY